MSVSALRELLADHARGELDDAALLAQVALHAPGDDLAAARAALLGARDEGRLPAPLCLRLLELFSDRSDDGDRTRLSSAGTARAAPPPDEDMTRVLPGGTAGATRGSAGDTSRSQPAGPAPVGTSAATTASQLADEDATAVGAPASDTTARSAADIVVDDDPTKVIAPTGAPTLRTAQEPAVDSTAAAQADHDPTAVVAPGGTGTGTDTSTSGTATYTEVPAMPSGGELGVGDEIKGRFRLLEKLGQGGMGSIWKAVDKRREEARDRNPYIAIKLLAGDFRNHPEAFIALQRECAKQQRLAHPNIATVYDFDRDGDTVFMTMSLLEGQPLDAYIRHLPAGGLSMQEAMHIIDQLAAGLALAHENGLVHSDLKPGNAFLIEDGTVRLLDFGIARASATREDAGGDTTVFDPGQLGALTPTYATVEMFDGQEPDPRDDIYALGIITYQLLTGQHPYGKKSAPKAMQLGLVPGPISKLDKRQNRGLRRSLAFLRDERTPSVAEFLDDIHARKSRAVPITIGVVAATIVIAALSWKPVNDYIRTRQNEEIIAVFVRGDEASIRQGLERVEALPNPDQRQEIAEDPRTRDAIIALYVSRRAEVFDPERGLYDFAAGERQMAALTELYPDSAEVLKTRNEFYASRTRLLAALDGRLRAALRDGRLLADPQVEDVADVLDIVRQVDPENTLPADPVIGETYMAAAAGLREVDDWTQAERVLEVGETLTGGAEGIVTALAEVRVELARRRDAARVAELDARWRDRVALVGDEPALAAAAGELTELQDLAPDAPLFEALRAAVDPLLEREAGALADAGDTLGARALLERYGRFAGVAAVESLRARLGDAGVRPEAVTDAAREVDSALAAPLVEPDRWSATLALALKRLLTVSAAGDSTAQAMNSRVTERLRGLAAEALGEERFEAAERWLALGERLVPADHAWGEGREAMTTAQTAVRERQAAAERAERLEQMRAQVLQLAGSRQAQAAREALAGYVTEAGAEDPFGVGAGREAVAAAYLASAVAAHGPEEALVATREGLEVAPGHAGLVEAERDLAGRVLERALRLSVASGFEMGLISAAPVAQPDTRAAPASVTLDASTPAVTARPGHPSYPALAAGLGERVTDTLTAAAAGLREVDDWSQAERVLEVGESLTGGAEGIVTALAEVRAELARRRDAARLAELEARWSERVAGLGDEPALAAAAGELTELQDLAPDAPLFEALRATVDPLLEREAGALADAGDTLGARALLERYGRFSGVAAVESLRARLGDAGVRPEAVTDAAREVDSALAAPLVEPDRWSATLALALKRLLTVSAAGDSTAQAMNSRVTERLRGLAAEALGEERFEAAERWLALGERLVPADHAWGEGREAMTTAQTAVRERQAAAERAERLEQMRAQVLQLAGSRQAQAAREALAGYVTEAGAEDPFGVGAGREAVAAAYLASAVAARGPEAALVTTREGLEVAPGHAGLLQTERELAGRVLERALRLSVASGFEMGLISAAPVAQPDTRAAPASVTLDASTPAATARPGHPSYPALGEVGARAAREVLASVAARSRDPGALRVALADYDTLYPQAGGAMRKQVGGELLRAIAENTRIASDGLGGLRSATQDFRELFPDEWPAFGEAVGARLRRDIERLQTDDLERAHSLLANARQLLPGSAPLEQVRLKPLPKASRYAPIALEQIEAGQLGAAQQTFAKMQSEEPDHEQLPAVRTALEQRLDQARAHFDAYQRYLRARRKREGQQYLRNAITLWTDNAQWRAEYTAQFETEAERPGSCSERLAGYGRRSRGTCYDETGDGQRGPVLVVVPAGGPAPKAFAIGKFEVSVAEYNAYCQSSGACKPVGGDEPSLPVTGISANDAKAYAKWLSTRTGAVYRLPSDAEWGYAADAGGQQPRKDFNCRVTSGGAIIKGHGLVDVQSGEQNGWGLANYVGNAQEWVASDGGLVVRGGAFEDPLARCEPTLKRNHDGRPDAVTGFRLLREIS